MLNPSTPPGDERTAWQAMDRHSHLGYEEIAILVWLKVIVVFGLVNPLANI